MRDRLRCHHGLDSRLKGIHHHIAGAYLSRYAHERPWRGDNGRPNGEQVNRLAALSLKRGKSVDFGGYSGIGLQPAHDN